MHTESLECDWCEITRLKDSFAGIPDDPTWKMRHAVLSVLEIGSSPGRALRFSLKKAQGFPLSYIWKQQDTRALSRREPPELFLIRRKWFYGEKKYLRERQVF